MVTATSRMIGGSSETVCAHVFHPAQISALTVELSVGSANITILEQTVTMALYRCVSFQVPTVSTDTVAILRVTIQGVNDNLVKETMILIKPSASITIIQTDKPIYKPGQTVQFRIVSLDFSFVPRNEVYKTVELQDPNSNRIAQWLDRTPVSGILDLSLPMSPEAAQGSYIITAWKEDGEQTSYTFDIKEYVLPKFEVTISLPSVITILDTETGHNGCATQAVDVTEFALTVTSYQDTFSVSVELEEFGTAVVLKGGAEAYFTDVIRTVAFERTATSYRPGLPFENKVIVTGPGSSVVANEVILLRVERNGIVAENLTLVTDTMGLASFSLETFLWNNTVTIQAQFQQNSKQVKYIPFLRSPSYNAAVSLSLLPFYSKSRSFLKISPVDRPLPCEEDATLSAKYIIQGDELKAGQTTLSFYYIVMSKGSLVQHGGNQVTVQSLAPVAQVVVYTLLPRGEIVADSIDFPIDLCLKNKVSLRFSADQALPGDNTTVSLQAHPGSLCSLRAIDQSVLLLKKEQELTVQSVYGLLPVQMLDTFPFEVEDNDPFPCLPQNGGGKAIVLRRPKPNQGKPFFVPITHENDVFTIFKRVGVKILTNLEVKKPFNCDAGIPIHILTKGGGAPPTAEEPKGTVRTYFPETWIWDLLPVGPTGSVSVVKEVPDTITTWAAGAFCTSPDVGLGLAPNVGLIAFKPFFVSLTLPYSVIRGEVFTLKATVFNYLTTCIKVKVTLAESLDFSSEGAPYPVCVCGEEIATFTWVVTIPVRGRADTVIQTLLVEAEGTPVTITFNVLLIPPDGPVDATISLELPQIYVPGSEKAFVSVLGDIMGRAIENLDKLLAMPSGCGEQNMLGFAPDVYILNYLLSSGQLTKATLDKATLFQEGGYQRELNYKLEDGSFSAFGKSDGMGNTWLTAFVMKSFGGARPFIFVDPRHIDEAKAWLLQQQREDGCFNSVGKLIHTELQGGVNDNFTLSAYITAALLELDRTAVSDPLVLKSLVCLKAALPGQLGNTYNIALLFYTFTLAGDQETRTKLLTLLNDRAKTQGGTRHWVRVGVTSEGLDSLEVEMTSYVLLALLSGPTLPGFGLEYSASIVLWLVKQQNPYGGFASTQDTVVALQALAKYGAATYRPNCVSVLSVSSKCTLRNQYHVKQSNRLLYQTDRLLQVPGFYYISAEGTCDVFAQVTLQYHIPPLPIYPAFNISLKTVAQCASSPLQVRVAITVRYNGRREETNLVIINFKLLSGFILDAESLKKNELLNLDVITVQDKTVHNIKAAVVKIYDYYLPNEQAVTQYTSPCV
ncbi:alpha-2-macroglobulin-like protein 1 [Aplochiton taeniatus]